MEKEPMTKSILESKIKDIEREIEQTESGERRAELSEEDRQSAIEFLEQEKKNAEEELEKLRAEIEEGS